MAPPLAPAPAPPSRRAALGLARWILFVSGAVVAFAPAVVVQTMVVHGSRAVLRPGLLGLATALCAGLLLTGGVILPRQGGLGRVLLTLGAVGAAALAIPFLRGTPGLTLVLVLGLSATFLLLGRSNPRRLPELPAAVSTAWLARGACLAATLSSLLAAASPSVLGLAEALPLGSSSGIALIYLARWLRVGGESRPAVRFLLAGGALVAALGLAAGWGNPRGMVGWLTLVPALAVIALPFERAPGEEALAVLELLLSHPPRLLATTFLALCLAGTLVLALPLASSTGSSIGYVDAMFTAVSAVCVTGLVVLDTSKDFSSMGQVSIALLIQFGALGIMTFSTAAMRILGRRLSMAHESAIAGLVSREDRSLIFTAVRRILIVTGIAEASGALVLTLAFLRAGDPFARALGRGVFTAISAFCNAGFALQTDSLIPYQTHGVVLSTVSVLIIAGGISPLIVAQLPQIILGRSTRAQHKLVVAVTVALLASGTIFFGVIEWEGALRGLSPVDKVLNAWLQSATRTAGFNSVEITALQPATVSLLMVWMFIGGSPGSTAGGIKTTTAAVLLLAVLTTIRGRSAAVVFNRRIPHVSVYRAASAATMAITLVVCAHVALQLTQNLPPGVALFEVVSALATVGLSLGGTTMLDEVGRVTIALCMFIGRVGPLTLFMFLSRSAPHEAWVRPEEAIEIG